MSLTVNRAGSIVTRRPDSGSNSVGASGVIGPSPGRAGAAWRRGRAVRAPRTGVGVAGLAVPEIGRQPRQPQLEVVALAIPINEGAHRKAVAEVGCITGRVTASTRIEPARAQSGKDGLTRVLGSVNAFLQFVRRMDEARSLYPWAVVGDLPAGPHHPAAGFSPYARLYLVPGRTDWPVGPDRTPGRAAPRASILMPPRCWSPARSRTRPTARGLSGCSRARGLRESGNPAVVDAERREMAVIDAAPDSRIVRAVEHFADAVRERTLDAA